MRKLIVLLLLLIFVVPVMAQSEDVAHVRIAQFSVDAPTMDVYIDGMLEVASVDFPVVSDWMEIPAGTHSIAIAPAGTSAEDAVIGPINVDFAADSWLTVAAIGLAGNNTLDAQVLVEDYSDLNTAEARLSVFHGILGVDLVNVIANGTTLIGGLGYPGTFGEESDGFETVDVVVNTYNIEIQLEDGTTAVDVGSLQLGENRNYFIALVGTPANPQFVVMTSDISELKGMTEPVDETMAEDMGEGLLWMRVAHFSPGSPPVDLYIDGELSDIQGLAFPELTEWAQLDAGIYEIAAVPAGDTLDNAILVSKVGVKAGSVVTLAVIGTVEQDTLALQVIEEDYSEPGFGEARLSFFHAIPTAPMVNVVANDMTLVQGLAYPGYFEGEGDGFATVDIVAGDYAIQIQNEDGSQLLDVGTIKLGPDRNYFIAAVGVVSNPQYVLVRTDIADLAP